MYKVNDKRFWKNSAKECAYIGVFVATLIAAQAALAVVAGVELVSVLLATFAFVFGVRRGVIAATAFSLLRTLVFGFSVPVFCLYILYYNAFALIMGLLQKAVKNPVKGLFFIVLTVCVCTMFFTLLDDIITPLYLGLSAQSRKVYFYASLPVMGVQVACAALSTAALFIPLHKVFSWVKNRL